MKLLLTIEGMDCKHCANHIKEELLSLNKDFKVSVCLRRKVATIKTDEDVKDAVLETKIKDAGYKLLAVLRK